MSEPLVLKDIHKTYRNGVHALRGVSLDIVPSEIVAIVGPSGCGKSTLLRTVNGLTHIDSGVIRYGDTVLSDPKNNWQQARQKIGMVFQSYELFPHLTVLKNLLLAPGVVRHDKTPETHQRALSLLQRVGLEDRANDLPRQLSGGQRQRVAIVRALMMNPEVLLLDEVTASLDPEMVREVLDVILGLADQGITMLIVTHEMSFARKIAHRVVFMDAGSVVEVAKPDQFFTHPSSLRAQQFLHTFQF